MARPANVIDQPTSSRMEEIFAEAQGGPLAIREAREVVAEKNLFGEVVTAQPCKVKRDEADVLRNIKTMAAAAGERWYYRFPVWNNRKKRQEHIEGISIKGTDSVGRYYGNCQIESVVIDHGPHWMIYSRFVDLETGYTLIRPFKCDKEAATLKTEDRARLEQIALGVGVSKGQRIVVDHALNDFTTYAFEEAKKSLVDEIGKNLAKYRERCVARLQEFGPAIVGRVELAYGRKAAEWLAHDIAAIRAEIQAIDGGLESIDETWPPPAPAEPRRSDEVTDVPERPPATAAGPVEEDRETGLVGAASLGGESGPAAHTPPASAPPAAEAAPPDESAAEPAQAAAPAEHPQAGEPKNWRVPDGVIGQDNILRVLNQLMSLVQSTDDVDQIELQNAGRIAKITGVKRATLNNALRALRENFIGS